MSTAVSLPHWDTTAFYPGLESPEFEHDVRAAIQDLTELAELFDRHEIGRKESLTVDQDTVEVFETVFQRYSGLVERFITLGAYIHAFVATDSRDDVAQAKRSEMQQHSVRLSQLSTRFTAWIGSLDVEVLIEGSSIARQHAFLLRKTKVEASHLMSPAEEALAAELRITGGSAWARVHTNITSQLTVKVPLEGQTGEVPVEAPLVSARREVPVEAPPVGAQREVPMSVIRNMAFDPNRSVRKAAYEAELDAWERVAVPLAAALNSIKGETNTLERRRGWSSALDVALFNNNIDRDTLETMLEAARASFPDFRRYLRAKARALDLPILTWYDLFAPVGESPRVWEFPEAAEFLLEQFGTYSSRLRRFVERAFGERWIDAEPRPGKRDGAFCMTVRGEESRILANYKPSYEGMSTLAHELGHGFHNLNLARQPILLRNSSTPMTLAETASIFCETIVREAALKRADEQEQVTILESSLQGSCQVVVDISSRFLFERSVFEGRLQRELSVGELKELMLDSQRQTYGDGLDEKVLHPYMWAVKGHYYGPGSPYYNFPYMFGLLFGLGLYARYERDPEAFRAGYDDLLASTGTADAATLAGRFGIDIRAPDFWNASFDLIRTDIDRFEALIDGRRVSPG